ncbi:galactokinase [Phycisphaerales bacterium AB-hyl4]|uniref:Galactokinase n=1 Tax=Natronomicrosphaera hydrolytica TaxID=3242702 RepID=A0ABV4U2L4_9BACT
MAAFPEAPGGTSSSVLTMQPTRRLLDAAAQANLFESGRPVHVARAPGRLDVMGGIADYSGAVVCELPLAVAAATAVQLRYDDQVVCRSAQAQREVRLPVERLLDPDPLAVRRACDDADGWARYPLGCVWWLLQQQARTQDRAIGQLRHGVTLAIDSDVPLGGGVASSAAIEVASMTAMLSVLGATLTPMDLAAGCQAVENHVVGAPCGIMDQATAVLGQADALFVLLCQPDESGRPARVIDTALPVPTGYTFVGVHSGVTHDVKGDSYVDTRVAAFIAQKLLSQLDPDEDHTRGYLANVDPERFISTWRAELPETMLGEVFLKRHGATNDTVTAVSPEKMYHVRAAATHHVLEAERGRQFIDLVRRCGGEQPTYDQAVTSRHVNAASPGIVGLLKQWLSGATSAATSSASEQPCDTETLMTRAGELMYASHASYGEYARLGHSMTDRLVEMARAIGPAGGVYGARITGAGDGGTAVMLVRETDDVLAKIDELRQQYTRETNQPTSLFRGSGPGAVATGTARV